MTIISNVNLTKTKIIISIIIVVLSCFSSAGIAVYKLGENIEQNAATFREINRETFLISERVKKIEELCVKQNELNLQIQNSLARIQTDVDWIKKSLEKK